jgi:hypothetical protein
MKSQSDSADRAASDGCVARLVRFFFILLGRVAAKGLDCLGRNAPRGGRTYCRACEQKTVRIRPQEYLRKGKLHPQCPRCGSKVEPLPRLLTGKLASRALRRWPDLSECSSHQLKCVVRTERRLAMQGRILRNIPSPNASSSLRQSNRQAQESRQTTHRKSRMSIQESPSRSRDLCDQLADRVSLIEKRLAWRSGLHIEENDYAENDQHKSEFRGDMVDHGVSSNSPTNVKAHPRGEGEPENQTGCFPASDAASCSVSSSS